MRVENEGSLWLVKDGKDNTVFSGTHQQANDWLDQYFSLPSDSQDYPYHTHTFDGFAEEVTSEDGGAALICCVNPLKDDPDAGVFFKIQSWDDEGRHYDFAALGLAHGKRVRIRLEVEE